MTRGKETQTGNAANNKNNCVFFSFLFLFLPFCVWGGGLSSSRSTLSTFASYYPNELVLNINPDVGVTLYFLSLFPSLAFSFVALMLARSLRSLFFSVFFESHVFFVLQRVTASFHPQDNTQLEVITKTHTKINKNNDEHGVVFLVLISLLP
jgi:hypothetical protein